MTEKLHWAPKLRQEKLWRLYRSDAEGLLDEELVAEVGYALLARCKSVVLVSLGQVECPRCGAIFQVRGLKKANQALFTCPTEGCGWQVTGDAYHRSWQHQDLIGNAGMAAFQAYITGFPKARSANERMLQIDRLLHAFHWGLKAGTPHRPVANNLIEGNIKDVVAFLDRLSFGEESEAQKHWREHVEKMWRLRRGVKEPMDSKQRFSSRVENYVRYRPGYPDQILEPLVQDCDLAPESIIADVGSGTGLLAQVFLAHGCRVIGIEPNAEMRTAGEKLLSEYPRFRSRDGSAEATGLPPASVDFVTAGQAFHWFDRARSREEFSRILKPGGWVALVWNGRRVDTTPFLKEYELLLLKYGTDYTQINHRNVDEAAIRQFFGNDSLRVREFENVQWFDFEGAKGRMLSSSYVPEAGQPGYEAMLIELRQIFDLYQSGGQVAFEYDTQLYYGQL